MRRSVTQLDRLDVFTQAERAQLIVKRLPRIDESYRVCERNGDFEAHVLANLFRYTVYELLKVFVADFDPLRDDALVDRDGPAAFALRLIDAMFERERPLVAMHWVESSDRFARHTNADDT